MTMMLILFDKKQLLQDYFPIKYSKSAKALGRFKTVQNLKVHWG